MTNEEALLMALTGSELAETEKFHPQNNEQAYLAYALGLLTDPDTLPEPQTMEQALLKQFCLNGTGIKLPELLNPAIAADIRLGKEAINQEGEVLTGECDIDALLAEIERLKALLDSVEDDGLTEIIAAIVSRVGGTSLAIPDVDLIGNYALYETDFSDVSIPESAKSIGNYAFCYMSKLKGISIPTAVASIGTSAFSECNAMTDIEIKGPATIGEKAFFTSSNSVTWIKNFSAPLAKSIGTYAFYKRRFNNVVEFPEVETVADYAFHFAYAPEIHLPKAKTIGVEAFSHSDDLTFVSIPSAVTIGAEAFQHSPVQHIELGEGLKTIGAYALSYCDLKEINMPSTVETIGNCAFDWAKKLTGEFTIPEACTSYGKTILGACPITTLRFNAINATGPSGTLGTDYITTVIFGDKVTRIPGYLCSGIKVTELDIPDSVTELGAYMCQNTKTLQSVTFRENSQLAKIGNYAFDGCSALLAFAFPDAITSVGTYLFQNCASLADVTFGPNCQLATLGAYMFSGCSALESIKLPDTVTAIPGRCFLNSGLKSFEFPAACTSIGECAFENTQFEEFVIPDQITSMSRAAFHNCNLLKKVEIGNGLTSLGDLAFGSSELLDTLIIKRSDAIVTMSKSTALQSTAIASGNGYIYVRLGLINTYKTATNWSARAAQFRPLVDTVEGLAEIDVETYTRAYVDAEKCVYIYDGTAWAQEVVE